MPADAGPSLYSTPPPLFLRYQLPYVLLQNRPPLVRGGPYSGLEKHSTNPYLLFVEATVAHELFCRTAPPIDNKMAEPFAQANANPLEPPPAAGAHGLYHGSCTTAQIRQLAAFPRSVVCQLCSLAVKPASLSTLCRRSVIRGDARNGKIHGPTSVTSFPLRQ